MKTKYFCGNCSREVSSRAAVCPYCGSSFTAVRCPRCGFEGKAAAFSDGCPACGFMMQEDVHVPASVAAVGARRSAKPGLPRIFYRVAGLVLIALVVVLVVLLLLRP